MIRYEKQHRRTNTYSVLERPLMTGYLFCGFHPFAKHFGMVRSCDGVLDFLGVDGTPIPIPGQSLVQMQEAEIDMRFDDTRAARIHRGEEERTRRDNIKKRFPKGKPVTVTDRTHFLADIQAVVDDVTSTGSVVALVNMFGQLVRTEFTDSQLTPAERPAA